MSTLVSHFDTALTHLPSHRLEKANVHFVSLTPDNFKTAAPSLSQPYTHDLSTTRKIESERRYSIELRENVLRQIIDMEVYLGIEKRWVSSSPEYLEVLAYLSTRTYQRALENLQRLVVQRLFELHKMNISATGGCLRVSYLLSVIKSWMPAYHMRTHIAKALQSRCKAIRNAVKTYNAAAAELDPPRAPISWEAVSHINFLEEFHLLHSTRNDIHEKPWSRPAVRETMKLHQRVKRAHEEIERCHIAVRRLYTAILDENDSFEKSLFRLQTGDPIIYGAVHDFITYRQQMNSVLLTKLNHLTNNPEYFGDCSRGVWIERATSPVGNMGNVEPASNSDHDDGDNDELDGESDIDDTDELVGQLVDYVGDLALLP